MFLLSCPGKEWRVVRANRAVDRSEFHRPKGQLQLFLLACPGKEWRVIGSNRTADRSGFHRRSTKRPASVVSFLFVRKKWWGKRLLTDLKVSSFQIMSQLNKMLLANTGQGALRAPQIDFLWCGTAGSGASFRVHSLEAVGWVPELFRPEPGKQQLLDVYK